MLQRLLTKHGRQALPWFTADEAYGDNPGLRDWLDEQDLNYVMAVSCESPRHVRRLRLLRLQPR